MDSGNNSGNLQSSSGGEEEYDSSSGGADHSSFLMPPSSSCFYGDTNLSSSTSSYLNFVNNIIIPQFPHLTSSSSPSPSSSHHPHLDPQVPILNQSRTIPPPSTAVASSSTKNPKKRTRASRRAPTTVLTTDTSNFRAMVQEFTGVPSPPFSSGHSLSSLRRFDIFRSPPPQPPSTSFSGHNLDYLYNPFRSSAQKAQPLIPPSSSSSLSSSLMNHHSNIVTSMASPTMNFHALSDLLVPKLSLETQNTQVPTFQSLMSTHHHHHQQQQQQSVPSLHELNAMNLGALQQEHNLRVSTLNCGDVSRQDENQDRLHDLHLFTIGQVEVSPLPEFDRRENGSETNNNVSSSSSLIKGTNTTTVDPWICPTD